LLQSVRTWPCQSNFAVSLSRFLGRFTVYCLALPLVENFAVVVTVAASVEASGEHLFSVRCSFAGVIRCGSEN
jgi:hypothetical protein